MVDIHTHILPFVDDGAKTEEQAINLLLEEESLGVTDVIMTPHYQPLNYNNGAENIKKVFEEFKEKAGKVCKINLHLGYEIYDDEALKTKELDKLNIGNSDYYLQEFPLENSIENVTEILYLYKRLNKKIVLAHVERYDLDKDSLLILKEKCLFQINASTVIGHGTFKEKNRAKWLLKNDLVDFVASDVHFNRENCLKDAYLFIEKKYGKERANRLFNENAKLLLGQ